MTDHFAKYLSGFFDGDGSILIEKLKHGFVLRIKFCQSNERFIDIIKSRFPVLHKSGGERFNYNKRAQYQLRAAGKQIEPLVDFLLPHSILKYEQLLVAKTFFPLINQLDSNDEKEEIYNKLKTLKKQSTNKPYERLCVSYIAGLFDAEGCITLGKSLTIKITQKSDITILQKIKEYYQNHGRVSDYNLYFHQPVWKTFLIDIQPHCIYKSSQIKECLSYLNKEVKKEEASDTLKALKKIDTSNMLYKTQEEHRQYLLRCWEQFSKLTTDDLLYTCKQDEILQTKVMPKFENKIFTTSDWTVLDIEPVLEFCENPNQLAVYQYYRKKVSSLPYTGVIGRAIRILVKDNKSQKYIGVMCLSSDVYNLGERDRFIGWSEEEKQENLNYLVNLSCCVPLQPFGFNTCGGKLLAKLAFSKEVYDYYYSKYKEPLLAIITTSINGKSIQYDRLEELKLIGFTKGYGSVYVPDSLYKVCCEYNTNYKVIEPEKHVSKFRFLKDMHSHLGLSNDMLFHGRSRGIYFGYLFTTKLDNKTPDISDLKTVSEISQHWFERFAKKRIKNLQETNRFKTNFDLYDEMFFKNLNFTRYELPEQVANGILTDDFILYILQFKSKFMTIADIVKEIKKEKNVNVSINTISKVFTGKIKPKDIDATEYLQVNRKKPSEKRKLTDEQIYFILDQRAAAKTYSQISALVKERFNVNCTSSNVSDVVLEKVKPYAPRVVVPVKEVKEKKLDNLLTLEQMLYVATLKDKKITTEAASQEVKTKFHVYVPRNLISRFWKGELTLSEVVTHSDEYQKMLSNKRQRVKAAKFTDDEIKFVKEAEGSLSHIAENFEKKFGKSITKVYVSKIRQ